MQVGVPLVPWGEPSCDEVEERVGEAVQKRVTDVVLGVMHRVVAFGEEYAASSEISGDARGRGVAEVVGEFGDGGEDPGEYEYVDEPRAEDAGRGKPCHCGEVRYQPDFGAALHEVDDGQGPGRVAGCPVVEVEIRYQGADKGIVAVIRVHVQVHETVYEISQHPGGQKGSDRGCDRQLILPKVPEKPRLQGNVGRGDRMAEPAVSFSGVEEFHRGVETQLDRREVLWRTPGGRGFLQRCRSRTVACMLKLPVYQGSEPLTD